MSIIIDPYHLPEKGVVELKINRSFEIKVTAADAQRLVRRWLRDEISLLIGADPPVLVLGEQAFWRVPVWVGFPQRGRAGIVGTVDVDVTTGEMILSPTDKAEIERLAEAVAAQQPPFQPKAVPEQYLAENVAPATRLQILADGTVTALTPTDDP